MMCLLRAACSCAEVLEPLPPSSAEATAAEAGDSGADANAAAIEPSEETSGIVVEEEDFPASSAGVGASQASNDTESTVLQTGNGSQDHGSSIVLAEDTEDNPVESTAVSSLPSPTASQPSSQQPETVLDGCLRME
mgnify:CR=1 FL=1